MASLLNKLKPKSSTGRACGLQNWSKFILLWNAKLKANTYLLHGAGYYLKS
jgi:hypothetical protein